ncbi:DUF6644 family protein [Phenylobacterium sp.]|uniref:DUF6644 family protein n=1 Tax=Phenylobacterium sp. TaxID=1871053 RepID=UPI00286A68ED|nr:DUF6644 family protein [Phenylobacterium sp.]
MIRAFLVWLQTELGKGAGETAQSWSEALLGSLNFWGLLEGSHLIGLMLFAGTILVVDLRLLGVTFRRTPVSVVSDTILPLTIFGFIFVVITGMGLFFAKPLFYYHNIWFRVKMIMLAIALINILIFHSRIQRTQGSWDSDALPPAGARAAAALSLSAWLVVITFGRLIAYDWFECGKPQPAFINWAEECKASEKGAVALAGARP